MPTRTLWLLLHSQLIRFEILGMKSALLQHQPMCLLWVIVLEHCPKCQIISIIHFRMSGFLRQELSAFPSPDLFPGSIYPLSIITSTWAGISATLHTREDRMNGGPGSPPLRLVKTPRRRLGMSSEELLTAGQHEDRLLHPHVTLDGRTVWGFTSGPRRFLNKSPPAML